MSPASASLLFRDPRLTACAASPEPAWVWSMDATQVLWANAAGAALLGSSTVTELTRRQFAPNDRTSSQVARLATSLSHEGAPRLERLRAFGTGFMRLLTAACARITLADGTQAIFIQGSEVIGQPIVSFERARRLFDGSDEALAVFSPDGALVYATPNGRQRTASANTLIAFNGSALASEALRDGASTGDTLAGNVSMVRIGRDASTLLVVRFGTTAAEWRLAAPVTPPVQQTVQPPVTVAAPTVETPVVVQTPAAIEPPAPVQVAAPVEAATPPAEPVVEEAKAPEAPVAAKPEIVAPVAIEPSAAEAPVPVTVPEPAAPEPVVSEAVAPAIPEPPAAPAVPPTPVMDRQHPLRFVWQMDTNENFTLASEDFINLIGPVTAQVLGKSWYDISATLQLDPDSEVARAVATRDTWSGVTVQWPADDSDLRLKVELSGLPIYDRQRTFTGYRGFGVCRDVETFKAINYERSERAARPPEAKPVISMPPVESATQRAAEAERVIFTVVPPVLNVLPFRAIAPAAAVAAPVVAATPAAEAHVPGLNDGERSAFSEIARQLSTRLKSAATPALRSSPGIGIDGRATRVNEDEPAANMLEDATGESAPDESTPSKAPAWLTQGSDAHALVDKLPLGVLIYRFETLFYANRAFLDQVGYASLPAFVEAGGLDSLFIETSGGNPNSGSQTLTITTGQGAQVPVEGRLFSIPWNGENALALVLVGIAPPRAQAAPASAVQAAASVIPVQTSDADRARIAELESSIAEARRIADAAVAERAELLGQITEQVRAPLSSAVSNVDTMLEERFGPIGNERYRAYLADIRGSGVRILSLFEDLSSLSKAESVKVDAVLPGINLNDIVKASVARMQPEASRVRVLIRTSMSAIAVPVAAEADSLATIVTNLLASSIRFAGPGGQVIVSTALAGAGKVVLRLRDTGASLSAEELAEFQSASNPNAKRPPADIPADKLTLAITLAMLEANHATLVTTSKIEDGTMLEVTFPASL